MIGAGGLGSPALLYLAASGVGKIGIVDKDCVELSNIHRQVIHNEASVSKPKTESAAAALKALNSSIIIEEFTEGFHPWNALDIVDRFDVVLDASDNAPTRYLISDACCVARKPLVSGAAIGTDGQLTVYCYGDDGPCYRCLFPKPPPPQNCARCADAGVLGPVPGIIGTMQALEVIKILAGIGEIFSRKLLMMDALYCRYHVVKLRARNEQCVACGNCPDVTRETLPGIDYMEFTGQQSASDGPPKPLKLVKDSHRISAKDLIERLVDSIKVLFTMMMMNKTSFLKLIPPNILACRLRGEQRHLLFDVRPTEQFNICSIPGSINTPWKEFEKHEEFIHQAVKSHGDHDTTVMVSVVCRRGNDSQRALQRIHEMGYTQGVDVIGGVESWARTVDPTFPLY